MSNLSGEVGVCFVVFVNIEFICADVLAVSSNASIPVASIAIAAIVIVYKDYLLADNPTSINFIPIRALADASIVQEHQRALALQASGGF